jgi:hypothetical protein
MVNHVRAHSIGAGSISGFRCGRETNISNQDRESDNLIPTFRYFSGYSSHIFSHISSLKP